MSACRTCWTILAQDLRTRAILLHLDRIECPRVFVSAARRAARTKPVIVLKAGRHEPPPPSLGLWRFPPDLVHDAVFRRVGLVRVNSVVELFDAAEFLARTSTRIQGRRVAIVSNSAGLAALAAITCLIVVSNSPHRRPRPCARAVGERIRSISGREPRPMLTPGLSGLFWPTPRLTRCGRPCSQPLC